MDRRYGWLPDLPDQRDMLYAVPSPILRQLPAKVDLRDQQPPVYDQGQLGSCVACATGSAHQFAQMKQREENVFIPSILFIYWNARNKIGMTNVDSGSYLRDGMKSLRNRGAPPQPMWPYDISKFRQKPPEPVYEVAARHWVEEYRSVPQRLDDMKGCLAEGYPFVFGFTVYDSYESSEVTRTGILPMPGPQERVRGGHAVKCVGYDDSTGRFIVKNSYSERWGDRGYFYMPYDYLVRPDLSADFWTLRVVRHDYRDEDIPSPRPRTRGWCQNAFKAAQSFVNAAVEEADSPGETTMDGMVEAGFRGLQKYLRRAGKVVDRQE